MKKKKADAFALKCGIKSRSAVYLTVILNLLTGFSI